MVEHSPKIFISEERATTTTTMCWTTKYPDITHFELEQLGLGRIDKTIMMNVRVLDYQIFVHCTLRVRTARTRMN